ncbi:Jouberin [Geranomyces michiganensis]|nr:Jouberin [Geranomyces michiganensis]
MSRSNGNVSKEHFVRRSSSFHDTRVLSDAVKKNNNNNARESNEEEEEDDSSRDSFTAARDRKSKNSIRRSSSATDVDQFSHQKTGRRRLEALKYDDDHGSVAASVGHLEKRVGGGGGRKLKARRRSSTTSNEDEQKPSPAVPPLRREPPLMRRKGGRLSKSDSALSGGPETFPAAAGKRPRAHLPPPQRPMPDLDEDEDDITTTALLPRRVLRHEQLAQQQQLAQHQRPKTGGGGGGGGLFSWKSVMSLSKLDLFGQQKRAAAAATTTAADAAAATVADNASAVIFEKQQQHTEQILRSTEQLGGGDNEAAAAAARCGIPFTPQQLVDYKDAVVSVQVHSTDRLIPDIRCQNPFVRIHIVDTLTGRYLQKLDPRRKVTAHNEPDNVDYILPVLTKTFSFVAHRAKTNPTWDETLLFNEPYLPLVSDRTMILFELLDVVTSKESLERTGTDGYYRIAWAFLKLVNTYNQPNTGRKARLQLYRYPPPDIIVYPEGPTQPHVYKIYQLRKHLKYPSTLYVTVSAHAPLLDRNVARRPEAPNEIEIGKETLEQLLAIYNAEKRTGATRMVATGVGDNAKTSNSKLQQWLRRPGQRCKLPNTMMYRIAATNAFASAFSPDGDLLAIACADLATANFNVIKIYAVRTGERVATLHGHRDLIYSLAWLDGDDDDDRGLVSTSSDGTARVWKANRTGQLSDRAALVLQHPAYVYSVSVHPVARNPRRIATACYDRKIRIWGIDGHSQGGTLVPLQTLAGHERNVNSVLFDKDGTRLYSADGDGVIRVWSSRVEGVSDGVYVCIKVLDLFRGSPISTLCLHSQNRRILVHLASHVLHTLDVRLYRILTTYEGAPPSVNRKRNSMPSSLVNTMTKRQVEFFGGTYIRPTYTPCGTMVLCGTEDGRALAWDTDSGQRVGTYGGGGGSATTDSDASWGNNSITSTSSNSARANGWLHASRGRPVVDIAYHPTANVACFVPFGLGAPVELWSYDRNSEDVAGAPAMTSHENIFANTQAFEEKLVSRKKEVAAMVDLVRQSIHNLAFAGGGGGGAHGNESERDHIENDQKHKHRRRRELAELGTYVGEARKVADIERAHNLGASHGSILVALDEDDGQPHALEPAEAQVELDERAKRKLKKKKKHRVTYEAGNDSITASQGPQSTHSQPLATEPLAS